MSYVELPALHVIARVFVCDDDDELGDLAADHPLVELGHDLLDVGLYLVIGRDLVRVSWSASGWGVVEFVPSMLRPYFLTLERESVWGKEQGGSRGGRTL